MPQNKPTENSIFCCSKGVVGIFWFSWHKICFSYDEFWSRRRFFATATA